MNARAVALLLVASGLAAAENARLLAAEASLAEGQPDQALALLRDEPAVQGFTRERLVLVRAQWALGNPAAALLTLDEGDGDCAAWPLEWRGQAAQLAGQLQVALGQSALARRSLAVALAHGRNADLACVTLAAELASVAGDAEEARRLALLAWQRQPRAAANAPAGLLLARLLAEREPTAARTVLAEVRAIADLAPGLRLEAAEQLCRLLLPSQPGQCLVVAERDMTRLADLPGTLPLYRALALAALDAEEAAAELAALPAELRRDPAVESSLARLALGQQADFGQRLERAAAAADLGRWDQVTALITADASHEPLALALLARCPGLDLRRLSALPTAEDPRAALALARGLVLSGQHHAAWQSVQPALLAAQRGGDGDGWVWGAEAARVAAPERVLELLQRAVAAQPPPHELGLAWGRLAETLTARGEPPGEAWLQAAERLPVEHPWHPIAVAHAARALLVEGGDLARAERLLLAPSQGQNAPETLRCRMLLAQVWARQGRTGEALSAARALLPLADAHQSAAVQAFIAGLAPEEGQPSDTP